MELRSPLCHLELQDKDPMTISSLLRGLGDRSPWVSKPRPCGLEFLCLLPEAGPLRSRPAQQVSHQRAG